MFKAFFVCKFVYFHLGEFKMRPNNLPHWGKSRKCLFKSFNKIEFATAALWGQEQSEKVVVIRVGSIIITS